VTPAACLEIGEGCIESFECCTGWCPGNNQCYLAPLGFLCSEDGQCATDVCLSGACACYSNSHSCSSNYECCSSYCDGEHCATPNLCAGVSCSISGETCNPSTGSCTCGNLGSCASLYPGRADFCGIMPPSYAACLCGTSAVCTNGLVCSNGHCVETPD